MTVKTPENTWGLPSQVVVTLYEPALAFELTVTVAVAELVPLGEVGSREGVRTDGAVRTSAG